MTIGDRIKWTPVIEDAVAIVNSYTTPVTLRQLFYRLVAAPLIPNTVSAYKRLSVLTAEVRREGWFPRLADVGRTIHRYASWANPRAALLELAGVYRRHRADNQDTPIYLGVEKQMLVAQMMEWFGDLSIPVLALPGYSSETYEREVARISPPEPTGAQFWCSMPAASITAERTSRRELCHPARCSRCCVLEASVGGAEPAGC